VFFVNFSSSVFNFFFGHFPLPDRSKKGSGCKIMPKKKKKRERRRNCASSRWRKKNEKHDWDAER
jgi:hypothetical protein